MRFAHPYILLLLGLVPALHLFYSRVLRQKNAAMNIFGLSCGGNRYGYVFVMASVSLLIAAMAGPQIGTEEVITGKRKADIVIAIDASLSMLARDDDKASRFDIAKRISNNLIERLGGVRLGLVAFAAKPIILSPLTTDANLAKAFLERADADIFWNQGTSLEMALKGGIEAFNKDKGRKKVMVILTDGDAPETLPQDVIDNIARQGIKVYTIGIGSSKGSQIPMFSKEGVFIGYKKDRDGKDVVTRLDEVVLKKIAEATGGAYYRQSDLSVDDLSQELLSGAEVEKTSEKIIVHKKIFQYPLGFAIMFFILGKILPFANAQRLQSHEISYYLKQGGIYGRE